MVSYTPHHYTQKESVVVSYQFALAVQLRSLWMERVPQRLSELGKLIKVQVPRVVSVEGLKRFAANLHVEQEAFAARPGPSRRPLRRQVVKDTRAGLHLLADIDPMRIGDFLEPEATAPKRWHKIRGAWHTVQDCRSRTRGQIRSVREPRRRCSRSLEGAHSPSTASANHTLSNRKCTQ